MRHVRNTWLPDSDSYFDDVFIESDVFQKDRLDAALSYVKNFRVAIDGGAHVGSWAREMSKKFQKVYAFEPAFDTFECLARNLFPHTNTISENKALGDEEKYVSMGWDAKYQNQGNTGARYVKSDDISNIQMVTIDSLNLDDIDFIKLDIEGAEYRALLGAKQTILKCKPAIFIETKKNFASRFGDNDDDAVNFLTSLGAREAWRERADRVFIFD